MKEIIKYIFNIIGLFKEKEKGIILENEKNTIGYKNKNDFEKKKRQIELLVNKYYQKGEYIKEQIDIAKENCHPTSEKYSKEFKKQNSKKVALSLCNTIARFIYTVLIKKQNETFSFFYLLGFESGIYKYKSKVFSYTINNCIELMEYYFNLKKYKEFSSRKYSQKRLVELFLESSKLYCLVRIKTGINKGHTFLGMRNYEGTEIIVFDQYHLDRIGKNLLDIGYKITWVYWY